METVDFLIVDFFGAISPLLATCHFLRAAGMNGAPGHVNLGAPVSSSAYVVIAEIVHRQQQFFHAHLRS